MTPAPNTEPITFERGLMEHPASSVLPPGSLSELVNWVGEEWGSLRCRRQWNLATGNGLDVASVGKRGCRGFGRFTNTRTFHTPTRRQVSTVTKVNGSGDDELVITWPAQTLDGSLLLAVVVYAQDDTMQVNAPAGWTLIREQHETGSATGMDVTVQLYAITNAAPRSGNETFDNKVLGVGSPVPWLGVLLEYTGVDIQDNNAGTDVEGSGNSTTGTANTNDVVNAPVTATTDTLMLAVFGTVAAGLGGGIYSSPSNGYGEVVDASETANADAMGIGVFERVVQGTAGVDPDMTVAVEGSNRGNAGISVAFDAKAGSSIATRILMACKEPTAGGFETEIYSITEDTLLSGTWTDIDTLTLGGVGSSLHDELTSFAAGLGGIAYVNSNHGAVRFYDGVVAPADIAGSPANGKCITFHRNRFFVGVGSYLHFCKVGDRTSWPVNYKLPVGVDDGEDIEDIAVVNDGLLIAKRSSLWWLSGNGLTSFQLHQLNGGGGAVGRCIAVTPEGAVVAGKRQLWFWSGGLGVAVASRPIEGTYETAGLFVTTASVDDEAYFLDEGSGTAWAYDVVRDTWRLEKETGALGVIFGAEGRLITGLRDYTALQLNPVRTREEPGSARHLDEGGPQRFIAETPEMWFGGMRYPVTPRHLWVQVRQRGGDSTYAGLQVTPYYDGVAAASRTVAPRDVGSAERTFMTKLNVAKPDARGVGAGGVHSVRFRFELAAQVDGPVFDIERVVFQFDRERERDSGGFA